MIADAKYKPLGNIGNRDYLQLLAYMFRFSAKKGFYLYPEADGEEDLILQMNQGSTYEEDVTPRNDIVVIKHGLHIPDDAEDYKSFVTQMSTREQEFRAALLGADTNMIFHS